MKVVRWARERSEGVELSVYIQPRASKTEIVGLHGEALKIRIAAPPVDGQANAALTRYLSQQLDIPHHHVQLISGLSSKQKRIFIKGITLPQMTSLSTFRAIDLLEEKSG
jgi:uncharacterized protein (TIGR00251 family)